PGAEEISLRGELSLLEREGEPDQRARSGGAGGDLGRSRARRIDRLRRQPPGRQLTRENGAEHPSQIGRIGANPDADWSFGAFYGDVLGELAGELVDRRRFGTAVLGEYGGRGGEQRHQHQHRPPPLPVGEGWGEGPSSGMPGSSGA